MPRPLLLLLLLLGAPAAQAFSMNECRGELIIRHPVGGSVVPVNANVHLNGWYGVQIADGLELAVDGVVVPSVRTDHLDSPNGWNAASLAPVEDYPPGATVSLLADGAEVISFTAGDFADTEPPVWDGGVRLEELRGRREPGCEPVWVHGFLFDGVTDDHTDQELLMAVGEPDVGDEGFAGGLLNEVSLRHPECPGDRSLRSTFRRTYTVHFIDGSGNRSGPFEVEVGKGCGCATGSPLPAPVLLAPGALFVRRRRNILP